MRDHLCVGDVVGWVVGSHTLEEGLEKRGPTMYLGVFTWPVTCAAKHQHMLLALLAFLTRVFLVFRNSWRWLLPSFGPFEMAFCACSR